MDPVYITNNWTDELLELMLDKFIQRKERCAEAAKQPATPRFALKDRIVSDMELFNSLGDRLRVVKPS